MPNIETISSRDNQKLIALRKIRDGKDRARVFIEGRRLVADAIRSGIVLDECYISTEFAERDLVENIDRVFEVSEKIFASIADTNGPQGILATARRPEWDLPGIAERISKDLPVVLWLKEPNNPSNLGAILRTAEAAGVAGVLISPGGTDAMSPKSIRGSMGSVFRLPVAQNIEFDTAVAFALENGLTATAVDLSGDCNYTEIEWKVPRLLVFGSEAHGLSDAELTTVRDRVVIKMNAEVESLNLAMAAGIILFEARRQNG